MTFTEILSMWLRGHGMTLEEADQLLEHKRMALALSMRDWGGVYQDLPHAIYDVVPFSRANLIVEAMRGPDALLLMQALDGCSDNPDNTKQASRDRVAGARPKVFRVPATLRILDDWFWLEIEGARYPLHSLQIERLARAGQVTELFVGVDELSRANSEENRARLPQLFKELHKDFGFVRATGTKFQLIWSQSDSEVQVVPSECLLRLEVSQRAYEEVLAEVADDASAQLTFEFGTDEDTGEVQLLRDGDVVYTTMDFADLREHARVAYSLPLWKLNLMTTRYDEHRADVA